MNSSEPRWSGWKRMPGPTLNPPPSIDSRSPKKDWEVGDVVGVLKIVRPLDREIANTREGLRGTFALMGTVLALLLAISVAATVLAQRRKRPPPV
jgi:hypothetical protein